MNMREIWRRETDSWSLIEFQKPANSLAIQVQYKKDNLILYFGSLGVSKKKLENVNSELLDNALAVLASVICFKSNISMASLWKNLLEYIPHPNDWHEFGIDEVECLQDIWEFINS